MQTDPAPPGSHLNCGLRRIPALPRSLFDKLNPGALQGAGILYFFSFSGSFFSAARACVRKAGVPRLRQ